jgi:hypothetical protein
LSRGANLVLISKQDNSTSRFDCAGETITVLTILASELQRFEFKADLS